VGFHGSSEFLVVGGYLVQWNHWDQRGNYSADREYEVEGNLESCSPVFRDSYETDRPIVGFCNLASRNR
jgi:hypothetical protein